MEGLITAKSARGVLEIAALGNAAGPARRLQYPFGDRLLPKSKSPSESKKRFFVYDEANGIQSKREMKR